ncbi:TRAP transporter small permease subunit, partial [Thalassolituus sp. UBA2590]
MKRLVQWLHRLEDSVLVLLLLAMIILAGYDILARSIFGGGVSWIPPLLRVMVLWIGLLGALLATRSREHISIDLISKLG